MGSRGLYSTTGRSTARNFRGVVFSVSSRLEKATTWQGLKMSALIVLKEASFSRESNYQIPFRASFPLPTAAFPLSMPVFSTMALLVTLLASYVASWQKISVKRLAHAYSNLIQISCTLQNEQRLLNSQATPRGPGMGPCWNGQKWLSS